MGGDADKAYELHQPLVGHGRDAHLSPHVVLPSEPLFLRCETMVQAWKFRNCAALILDMDTRAPTEGGDAIEKRPRSACLVDHAVVIAIELVG